ncbi:hypothetical protein ACQUQP_04780 [Marinobacterium sp. YM272]|uniref:hypothetical protein n=1 Tax=Marinobacterium sp. YM272 TaxID=3421654 RepID=UPI003D7F28E9
MDEFQAVASQAIQVTSVASQALAVVPAAETVSKAAQAVSNLQVDIQSMPSEGVDWMGVAINFSAVIIGAIVGGIATLMQARRSFEHQQSLLKQQALNSETSLLEALKSELKAVSKQYMESIGDELDKHPESEPFNFYFPLYSSYFSIFDSNATTIGLVRNGNLRDKIITAYSAGKGLIDSYQHNNMLVQRYDDAAKRKAASPRTDNDSMYRQTQKQLANYCPMLKKVHYVVVQ